MIWFLTALIIGIVLAGLMSALVFRVHSEWKWMKPKKACIKCEVPRSAIDLVPVLGDIKAGYRCKKCKSFIAWQYPVIESIIVLIVLFHACRYAMQVWVPVIDLDLVWWFATRDIVFSLFLLTVFVYDLKYELILDRFTIPAVALALIFNMSLGVSGYELVIAMTVLFAFFLIQHALSGGRLLGAGDVRMALVIGAMLGFSHGIGAVLLAYVLGAIVGAGLLLTKRKTLTDHVPFGTFLAVATLMMLVWGDVIIGLLL